MTQTVRCLTPHRGREEIRECRRKELPLFSPADLADAIASLLRRIEEDLAAEQAVNGIDAMAESLIQGILADALGAAGYEVRREARYPSARHARRLSEGNRCDLVLTPQGSPLAGEAAHQTLFDPPEMTDPCAAWWLELKIVHQFHDSVPHTGYASELLAALRGDAAKLAAAAEIAHRAVVLLLFSRSAEAARHDLEQAVRSADERGLPIGSPRTRGVCLCDRAGHAHVEVAVIPIGAS